MTAPVATETWNNLHVSVVGGGDEDERNRELMFKIKDALITGVDQGEWTVVSSSDHITADANDNWTVDTDLVWAAAGSAHSWIVLQQAGMGGGSFQFCIDLAYVDTSTEKAFFLVSYSDGFAGGTTEDRPTANDEQNIASNNYWGPSNDVVTKGANILKTESGKCTRIIISDDGSDSGFWFVEEPKDAKSWWTTPYLGWVSAGLQPRYVTFQEASYAKARIDGEEVECYISCEGFHSNALPQDILFATSDYNGEWVCCPAGIVSNSTSRRGRIGEIRDWWWISDDLNTGDYMPGDASKLFVVINDLLQPWDGSNIVFD